MERRTFLTTLLGATVAIGLDGATGRARANASLRRKTKDRAKVAFRNQGTGHSAATDGDPEWWGDFCEDLGGGASSQSDGSWRCANSGGTTLTATPPEENSTQPED